MAVATRNSELIPESELNVLIKYNQELLNTKANLGAIIPVLHNAALGVETYTGEYKTLVQMLQTFEKTQQDTSKRVREHSNALSAVEKATKQFAYAQSAEAKEVALVKEQLRQKNAELRTNAREALAAEGSLNQLRAQLVQLKAEAANLDLNSKEFAEASARINELNGKIMKAEAAMGDHRRNVGNYASAFNGLGFQIQQVARELPSLTIGASQFFLAISNNLPMLTDELKRAVDENKAFREANKGLAADQQTQVVPVWKQLLKSILSWQTALVVGITLITAYSKEIGAWIKQLFAGRDALEDVRKASDELTTEVSSEIIKMNILLSQLKNAKKGSDEYKRAKDELISQYDQYLPNMESEIANLTDEIDLRNKLAAAIYKETTAKKQAEAATKAQEEYLKKATRKVGNRLNEYLFSNTFGEEAAAYQEAYVLALIGNEEQQQIARDIEEAIRQYYREAYARANTWNFDKKSKEEQQMLISTSPSDVVDESLADIRRFASEYSTQLDAVKQLGEDTAAALGLLYGDSDGNGNNGDGDKALKTLASLREEISKLQQDIEQVNLSAPDADKELANLNSQLQAKEKELKVAEQIAGIDKKDSSTTTTRLSEKRRAELELLEAQAQQEAAIQEQIYKDEERAYADRLDAFEKFKEAQQKVLDAQYTASREELDARLSGGDIDKDTYDAVLSSLDFANSEAFRELTAEQQAAGKELMEAIAEGMMSETTRAVEQSAQDLDRKMQDELLALSAKYAAGEIKKEEYEKESAAITDRYAVERFNTEIGLLDQLLNKEELTAEAREETEKAKDDAVLEYQKYINDQRIRENERVGDEEEKEAEKREQIAKKEAELKKQLLQEVFNLASALSDAQLEKELDRLDKLSEENQQWKEDEIARIERLAEQGVISEEHADADIQAIEDQAAVREEEIEKKRIEAERKNAIFEKAQAVAQAAINTALAITAALTSPFTSAAMIPLIAATGAAQIATILATPLPEYAKGTQDHPGGLAMVGDGGRAEMVVFPDGSVWRTPATDTLVNLPEHTKVLPDYDAVIAQHPFRQLPEPISTSRMETLLEEQRIQRGTLIEKSAEQNRLLRRMIMEHNADRRTSQRTFANHNMITNKKIS